jgi:hypothetical protein
VNGIAYWLVGVPLAYILCFVAGYNLIGLWFGMSAGTRGEGGPEVHLRSCRGLQCPPPIDQVAFF